MPIPKLQTTEADLREQIRTLCELYGWKMYFTWNSKNSPSGFPDLVLAHSDARGHSPGSRGRLIFAELKQDGKVPTPAQQDWLDCLAACGQECYVWHPDDITEIARLLQPRGNRKRNQEGK